MGSSQERSIDLIKAFKDKTDVEIAAHLTLFGKSKRDLRKNC